MESRECIVYNFFFVESLGQYLPSAFISELGKDGRLKYMIAKALIDNIASYGLAKEGSGHLLLLDICNELTIENLEKKFSKKGRKKYNLSQLYEDKSISHLIKQFLHRKISLFMKILLENKYPLCFEVERKVFLEDIRIQYTDESLEPFLRFEKTQTGINYSLELGSENDRNRIKINQHDVHIISDHPGFIILDYRLYALSHLNGNKLKPFLKKERIFIPERITHTYFSKFIMEMVSKVDIKAIGFEVVQESEILGVKTSLTRDLFNNTFLVDLVFDYGLTSFLYSENAKRRTRLLMDDNGLITIKQAIRSEKEADYVKSMIQEGMVLNNSQRFALENTTGINDAVHWLIHHSKSLALKQIQVTSPEIDGKQICMEASTIQLSTLSDNDWFDIKGQVKVGNHTIRFVDLLENIKEENPYYKLNDGTYFIIPDSWMAKYASLAKFGKKAEKGLRIKKSNYTLVEELELQGDGMKKMVFAEDEVDYIQSKNLKADLRPYQEAGVRWLIKHQMNGLGACLADDMGLGKTLQTLAVLDYTKNRLDRKAEQETEQVQLSLFEQNRVEELNPLRALVILPASLVFNWYAEIKKFCPHFHVCQYIGAKRKGQELDKFDIILTTYQTALRDIKLLQSVRWEYIVLDESQTIKNKESKIFQAVNTLETNNKITLSGTPIENSLSDLWSQMQFINPEMLGSYPFFKEHFLNPIEKHQDEDALESLKNLVTPFILRRRKEEVAKDLPELTQMIEYVEMEKVQKDIFDKEKSAARNYLLSMDNKDPKFRFHVFSSLLRLRQIANHPVLLDKSYEGDSGKFIDVTDKLETVIKSGQKVLIFSSFKTHLKLYADYLKENNKKYVMLTGDTTQENRKKAVNMFQNNDSFQVFLISIKAGGTGLNLTKAGYVFILDPWWNPFVEEQAIARAHRIGQENPVTVLRFISKDSIEEKIIKMQARKKVLSAELIESQEKIDLAREDLRYLLE